MPRLGLLNMDTTFIHNSMLAADNSIAELRIDESV